MAQLTELEAKLLLDRVAKLEEDLKASKAAPATPNWTKAAPQGPLHDLKGRCVQCGRIHTIKTDDLSKGVGFRHKCVCQKDQYQKGGDVTTWHARVDIQPPNDDNDEAPSEPPAPKGELAARRVPAGGSKIEPAGGVSA